MSRGFWLGLVGVALVRATVPQISTVVVPANNVAIPGAVVVTVTGISDFQPSGKIQIKLADGTVVAERTYINPNAAPSFVLTDVQNTYKIEDTFTFPNDANVAPAGTATWTAFASLTNVNGTTDTTQAIYSSLTTTFPVTVTAPATNFVTTPGTCNGQLCPGSVVQLPTNPTGGYNLIGQTVYGTPAVPASLIKGSGSATYTPGTVIARNGPVGPMGTAASGKCHTFESITTATTTLVLDAPMCLINSQINVGTWTSGPANQFIRGSGSSKILIPTATTPAITTPTELNVLVQNAGSLTVGAPTNIVFKGKISQQSNDNAQTIVNDVLTCALDSSAAVCAEFLQGSVSGTSRLDVKVGVVRVNTQKNVNPATIRVGASPQPLDTKEKIVLQQQSTQIGGPSASYAITPYTLGSTQYACGPQLAAVFFQTVEVYQNGAVFISQSCAADPTNVVTNPIDSRSYQVAATGTTFDFKGGKLVFLDAKKDGAILVLTGDLLKSGLSGTIEVQLTPENMPTSAFRIYLIRYASATCDKQITTIILNAPAGRTPMQGCTSPPGTTTSWIYISIPEATPAVSTNQTQARPFQSQNKYSVTLGRECGTVTEASFRKDVANTGLDADAIADLTLTCGSVIASFTCRDSSSSANADATCQSILDQANSGSLRTPWNTQGTSVVPLQKGSASNTGLYALFVLVLVPIFCIFCICLLLRNKRRRADNQYKQDTATFANVASSPQPINYPYPYAGDAAQAPYGFADVAKPAYELQPVAAQAPYGY